MEGKGRVFVGLPRPAVLLSIVAGSFGCAPIALAGPDCQPTVSAIALPPELEESSGIAIGLRDEGVLWTHNDDGSVLFAIDSEGMIRASIHIRPRLQDWEDIESAPCEAHGTCLYLADTGDNAERRPDGHARLMRIAEPASPPVGGPRRLGDVEGEVFPIRLPQGARDIEALFVLPGERIFLVSKGRNDPITVYRYPGALRPDTVTVEEVQRLSADAAPLGDQVTGASTMPGGEVVSIRTYQSLEFFRVDGDTLAHIDGGLVNLRTLREAQGEAVALGRDGLVILTSEAGPFGGSPSMSVMHCSVAEGLSPPQPPGAAP